jgi:hypothetical protein
MISKHDNIEIAQERRDQYADIMGLLDEVYVFALEKWKILENEPRDDTQRFAADELQKIAAGLADINYQIVWGAFSDASIVDKA